MNNGFNFKQIFEKQNQENNPLKLLDFLLESKLFKLNQEEEKISYNFYSSNNLFFNYLNLYYDYNKNNFIINYYQEYSCGGFIQEKLTVFEQDEINIQDFISGKLSSDFNFKHKKFKENLIEKINNILPDDIVYEKQ